LAIVAGFIPLPDLTTSSRICLILFVGAAGLWVTSAIPPFATAILVIVLSVFLLGNPSGMPGNGSVDYKIFVNPIASPVLILFFGGFMMAAAATKHGFDLRLAKAFIKPFGTDPKYVLLGIILTTGVFSMFMSNTATTAMMIAILTPVLKHFKGRDTFKKVMVLAVPFAANIGGVGTLIGTPPNAVAASILNDLGRPISFLGWMMIGFPLAVVLLFILWVALLKIFKPRNVEFDLLFPEQLTLTWDLLMVFWTFIITVLLWLTEPLHHIPAAVVAMLPIMVFTLFGILDQHDLKKLDWDVIILVAGGLTLGVAMKTTGLSEILVSLLSVFHVSPFIMLLIIILFSMALSNFMSNTSAANVIIPIVTSMAIFDPLLGALAVAFACSLAMSLPISTPPNAIAFATHAIETKELAKYGTMMSMFGVIFIVILLAVIRMFV